MSLLTKILKKKLIQKSAIVSVLGPSQSGKTTFIRYLETGIPQLEEPLSTLGIEYRAKGVKISNWRFALIDVGGQKVYQDVFWEMAIGQADAIIYVIDATVRPEKEQLIFKYQVSQFEYVLDTIPEESVLMILLNKQDLIAENPITTEEFPKLYPITKIRSGTTIFLPSSAKYGTGIEKAMDRFIDAMNKSGAFS
ncbi:MAG: ADP-ribosylation factor-like protein [Candidatus Hodarchaeota archaeon]